MRTLCIVGCVLITVDTVEYVKIAVGMLFAAQRS